MSTGAAEHEEKLERVARLAQQAGLQGVLLAAHHNIAWLTSGRGNRIDASREAGLMLGGVARELEPGDDERDIARTIIDGAVALRARPIVTLVGSDDRLRSYRHPVPTKAAWKSVVMIALCAERDGLVVSL